MLRECCTARESAKRKTKDTIYLFIFCLFLTKLHTDTENQRQKQTFDIEI